MVPVMEQQKMGAAVLDGSERTFLTVLIEPQGRIRYFGQTARQDPIMLL